MKEQNILKTILLEVCRGSTRLWRSNVGIAWVGESRLFTKKDLVVVNPGDVVIRKARPFHAGFKGLSDLIGYDSVDVTQDMVGQRLAVFTAVEVKSERGRPTVEQKAFLERVKSAGGNAGIARSPEDARKIIGR